MKKIFKIGYSVLLNAAIICHVGVAEALIPMPFSDPGAMGQQVQSVMQQVQEMQEEVKQIKSDMEEMINGGFMAAAGSLFGQFTGGGFDRFGQDLGFGNFGNFGSAFGDFKGMQQQFKNGFGQAMDLAKQAAQEAKKLDNVKRNAIDRRTRELMSENSNMSEAEARSKAESEYANKSLEEIIMENQTASKLNRTYRWLRDSSAPSSIRKGIGSVKNGDWGQALSSFGEANEAIFEGK